MKHLFLNISLLFFVALLCACSRKNDVVRSPANSESPAEITEKRIEYREALKQSVKLLDDRFKAGMDGFGPLIEARIELTEIEIALADTQEERYAALENMLKHATELEEYVDIRIKAGAGRTDELELAKAGRLRAELLLLEEKHRASPQLSATPAN